MKQKRIMRIGRVPPLFIAVRLVSDRLRRSARSLLCPPFKTNKDNTAAQIGSDCPIHTSRALIRSMRQVVPATQPTLYCTVSGMASPLRSFRLRHASGKVTQMQGFVSMHRDPSKPKFYGL